MQHENVYLRKIGNNKYELITKDFDLIPRVYRLFKVDDIIILKPEYVYKKEEPKKVESPVVETKVIQTDNNEIINNTTNEQNEVIGELKTYFVIENQNVAKELSLKYSDLIKKREIIGIKGFDKKYYIFRYEYFSKIRDNIIKIFLDNNNEASIEDFKKIINEPEDALRGTIEMLKEDGLIFEKVKNKFKYID